jgi:hypothetical protein
LNIIDHWLKLPNPQKSLQSNIIVNMLENPRNLETIKLDIARHDELPRTQVIQNLIDGTFATEIKIDYNVKAQMDSRWFDYAQRKVHLVF